MYRVFLIDDEPWVTIGLERLIAWEELGFQVAARLEHANRAWERIRTEVPDVVISDIRMPGLTGLELLGNIRREGLPVEVVLVSGFAEFSYAQEALRQGAFEYLLKPVRREQLQECMQRLRNKLQSQKQVQETLHAQSKRARLESCTSFEDAVHVLQTDAVSSMVPGFLAVVRGMEATTAFPGHMVIGLGHGETLILLPGTQALPDMSTKLETEKISLGAVRVEQENDRLEQLLYKARVAWRTAQWLHMPTLVYTANYQDDRLLKAAEHRNRELLREMLQELESCVLRGEVMSDQLFGICTRLEHWSDRSIGTQDWKQYTDMLQAFPDADALFQHLLACLCPNPETEIVKRIEEEIRLHFDMVPTLSEFSREFNMSQASLSQLIHRSTGKTYSELIQDARMGRAKELLTYSEKTMGEIAQETGYADPFYFSKLFKKLFGQSPNSYRKQTQSGKQITKSYKK